MTARPNRWDKRRQLERQRDPLPGEIARVVALRDRMQADLQHMQGKLEGIELSIRIVDQGAK